MTLSATEQLLYCNAICRAGYEEPAYIGQQTFRAWPKPDVPNVPGSAHYVYLSVYLNKDAAEGEVYEIFEYRITNEKKTVA